MTTPTVPLPTAPAPTAGAEEAEQALDAMRGAVAASGQETTPGTDGHLVASAVPRQSEAGLARTSPLDPKAVGADQVLGVEVATALEELKWTGASVSPERRQELYDTLTSRGFIRPGDPTRRVALVIAQSHVNFLLTGQERPFNLPGGKSSAESEFLYVMQLAGDPDDSDDSDDLGHTGMRSEVLATDLDGTEVIVEIKTFYTASDGRIFRTEKAAEEAGVEYGGLYDIAIPEILLGKMNNLPGELSFDPARSFRAYDNFARALYSIDADHKPGSQPFKPIEEVLRPEDGWVIHPAGWERSSGHGRSEPCRVRVFTTTLVCRPVSTIAS
ncbi:hypothetical protein NKH18_45160 [Streptomyces sp. M10(2022)]